MLRNDFFEIVETIVSENKITAKIKLNAGHRIYAGHFPGNPVTPGVVQIQIVKEILEFVYKKDLNLISVGRCKFLAILNPTTSPVITIDISFPKHIFEISAAGADHETVYFKLSATFSDEPRKN